MNLKELIINKKDNFGGDLTILPVGLVKGRNLLAKNGFIRQPNELYMKKDNQYWHYNRLLGFWLFEMGD